MKVPRLISANEPDNTPLEVKELSQTVVASLLEHKATNVVSIDLRGKADFADQLVIASAISDRHAVALADYLNKDISEKGIYPISVEGKEGRNWVLIDYGDIVVHIFVPEARAFYNLERLWDVVIPKEVEKVL